MFKKMNNKGVSLAELIIAYANKIDDSKLPKEVASFELSKEEQKDSEMLTDRIAQINEKLNLNYVKENGRGTCLVAKE